jgi:hypothetical protein
MSTQESKRRLTAILSADVKGYSRLMSQDEEGTVKTLKQHRTTISELVSEHRGRVVDSPGDNILAEFGSVEDAVKCAVKIQETLKGKNAELPENRRMEFRIRINLGDVIEEEEGIYGDGVNIAARNKIMTARTLFEQSIALDPNYPWPYVNLGLTQFWDAMNGWSATPAKSLQTAFELAQKALAMDESRLPCAWSLGPYTLFVFPTATR